jgi:hypothetical protein
MRNNDSRATGSLMPSATPRSSAARERHLSALSKGSGMTAKQR